MNHVALLLLAAHMVGDYILQTNWMAANKFVRYRTVYRSMIGEPGFPCLVSENFWFSFVVRSLHVLCYTACFVPVMFATTLSLPRGAAFLSLLFALHWITDCRRWASDKPWAAKPIMVDQSLHIAQIACLAWWFGL